ncbi:MAG TPA: hypothetical protein VEB42_00950 [Chitinophagaceae bacterium]|nr:hypothetical protein [Chitinophagaceae bacterium]
MIILRTTRHFVEAAKLSFFPYINLYKQTRLNNIAHKSLASEEYLNVLTLNCLLDEVEEMLTTKLASTQGPKINYKLSDAHGVVLYQVLLKLELPDEHYISMVRCNWIEQLDQEIIRNGLYLLNAPVKAVGPKASAADYME